MARATADDQLKFLLNCVKHANNGKIDFIEVARECGIVSKGAAAKRYERLMKANGINPNAPPAGPTVVIGDARRVVGGKREREREREKEKEGRGKCGGRAGEGKKRKGCAPGGGEAGLKLRGGNGPTSAKSEMGSSEVKQEMGLGVKVEAQSTIPSQKTQSHQETQAQFSGLGQGLRFTNSPALGQKDAHIPQCAQIGSQHPLHPQLGFRWPPPPPSPFLAHPNPFRPNMSGVYPASLFDQAGLCAPGRFGPLTMDQHVSGDYQMPIPGSSAPFQTQFQPSIHVRGPQKQSQGQEILHSPLQGQSPVTNPPTGTQSPHQEKQRRQPSQNTPAPPPQQQQSPFFLLDTQAVAATPELAESTALQLQRSQPLASPHHIHVSEHTQVPKAASTSKALPSQASPCLPSATNLQAGQLSMTTLLTSPLPMSPRGTHVDSSIFEEWCVEDLVRGYEFTGMGMEACSQRDERGRGVDVEEKGCAEVEEVKAEDGPMARSSMSAGVDTIPRSLPPVCSSSAAAAVIHAPQGFREVHPDIETSGLPVGQMEGLELGKGSEIQRRSREAEAVREVRRQNMREEDAGSREGQGQTGTGRCIGESIVIAD